jgi:hypothetical protein
MSGLVTPELTQLLQRCMSTPVVRASESKIGAGAEPEAHRCWLSKMASCICQNFPCAPAHIAASAETQACACELSG